ncbi:hypothetical protein ACEPAI_3687 [Sanghuangporus weigelae]
MTSPPPAIRDELTAALSDKSSHYWETLNAYLGGKISRVEYEEIIREAVNTPHLVQLHNSLIVSVLGSSLHHAPPTPPPDAPGKPLRKRRRTTANADAEDDSASAPSTRLKMWAVGMGKRERERVKALEAMARTGERRPKHTQDEIAQERGIQHLLDSKGRSCEDVGALLKAEKISEQPGTYTPVHLTSVTRAPTLQHVSERVALICAQHDLKMPTTTVAKLMLTACEAKLKQMIAQALALTSTSRAITSIQLAKMPPQASTRVLTTSAFESLLTVRPAVLPYQSAAATRLIVEGSGDSRHYDQVPLKERHTEDPRWQILAVLAERSTVREALLTGR